MECEDIVPSWDDYETEALDEAVDFFENFLSDVNRKKLRKWVKNNVTPTDIFEDTDDYWEIIEYFGDCGEDPFIEFFLKFSPDTEEWEELNGFYEEMWGCPVEENIDEGYGEDFDFMTMMMTTRMMTKIEMSTLGTQSRNILWMKLTLWKSVALPLF